MTSGNLSVQLKNLSDARYITARKEFVKLKPRSTYKITAKGRKALKRHLSYIEDVLKSKG